ncbi:adenosylhomocysteinase [Actinacidiphila yanglinensis]|uniref:Adenosylhomocysteinase n=1 Tax=Actinacidiphila yanglinensis TaxID=310779 RepID=A0A1H5YSU3_9ACTN|nr:adenosylhomocysteinase [Actinacidiphila yanglinensis]
MSVARSPLKDPEDFLVGQSVVFSTEALMRGRGDIMHGRPALVIGFGKLGSSIARLLHAKGVQVTVYDIDPIRRTQALSQGFTVARDRDAALHNAGLVLCATGSVSLRSEDFSALRNGAYVATVTSSEDELDLAGLPEVYNRTRDRDHVTRYQTTGHYFYCGHWVQRSGIPSRPATSACTPGCLQLAQNMWCSSRHRGTNPLNC